MHFLRTLITTLIPPFNFLFGGGNAEQNNFLLLDNSDFLLLDGTNFLLL